MAVHMLVAEDSDGDSWLEVLEGSPGPSIQNSRVLESPAQEKVESPHAWAIDETWVSELGEYKDTEIHDESEKDAGYLSVHAELFPSYNLAEDAGQLISNSRFSLNVRHSQLGQKLDWGAPEIGDLKRHFTDVQRLATMQPRKGLHYRLWLCWMYRMEWPQIEHAAQHAPEYIVQVANYWFGLRNHPFWTFRGECPSQWYEMYRACSDIWKWWDDQYARVRNDSDKTTTEESTRSSAVAVRYKAEPPSGPQVENQYSVFHGRSGEDKIRSEFSAPLQLHEDISVAACQVGDLLTFVTHTYHSFDRPCPDQAVQRDISFQAWVNWICEVNLQPSSKPWAGHDLWPPSSPSTTSMDSSFQCHCPGNIGDVASAYVRNIGLPYQAALYYQSVSYI